MCLVIYIASNKPLPLVPWDKTSPGFNVVELSENEECVRIHFSLPHVSYAGSHTSCGCGFNEGREHAEYLSDPKERVDSLASSSRLASYVREHQVGQIYSCWSGDEAEPKAFERQITPDALVAEDFFFRERELFTIGQKA